MSSEANQHALARLAQLLRRRHSRQGGRDFVVLGVDGSKRARTNNDDLVTQQMPVLRNAR